MSTDSPFTRVRQIMQTTVRTVTEGAPLSDARKLMMAHDLHHVPVVNDAGLLVGIVSSNDLLSLGFGDAVEPGTVLEVVINRQHPLSEVMSRDIVTTDPGASIADAARLLATGKFHSLPVVEGRRLVGIVTSTDLIGLLYELVRTAD